MKKQFHLLKNSLMQGIDPHHLSLTFLFAVLVGLIPVWGVSSIILTFLAFRFQLNLVLIQFISWLMIPLQFFSMYFFFQLGNEWMGEQSKPIDWAMFKAVWEKGFIETLYFIYQMHVNAFLLWLGMSVLAGLLFYPILKWVFSKFKKR